MFKVLLLLSSLVSYLEASSCWTVLSKDLLALVVTTLSLPIRRGSDNVRQVWKEDLTL